MNGKKTQIYLIEDNIEEQNIIKKYFENDDEITTCGVSSNGEDGFEKIKSLKPDIVLTDFVMPGMDGLMVLKKLKNFFGENRPKVIFISASGSSNIVEAAFAEGADYYLKKPIELSAIKDTINFVLSKKNQNEIVVSNKVRQLTMSFGVPVNVTGYTYIINSVAHMLSPHGNDTFLNEVYRNVADVFKTTAECVEISIRNAIKKAFARNTEKHKIYFGEGEKPPSNSLFLNTLKEIMLIDEEA